MTPPTTTAAGPPRPPGLRLRLPPLPVGARIAPRTVAVNLILAALIVAVAGQLLSRGEISVPLADLPAAVLGRATDPLTDYAVHTLRLPRLVLALVAGAALGLSGALFQNVVRNPLASPDVLGITGGASAGAVIAIAHIGTTTQTVFSAALAGGLLAAAVIYALAWRGGMRGYRFVLIGVAVAAFSAGLVQYVLSHSDSEIARETYVWVAGSLADQTWEQAGPLAIALLALIGVGLLMARPLRAISLGDDLARSLGVRLEPARLAALAVGVGLAALPAARLGPISFVAFVAPQVARRLARTAAIPLTAAALTGALLLAAADLTALHLLPTELPVGIVTSVIGGPYLLWLLIRGIPDPTRNR